MPTQFQLGEFLYAQNEFLVALCAVVLFLAATEMGFRRGRAMALSLADTSKSELSTLQGAVMGLLALLLAFSFAMAESRFELRQSLEVEEANALGTVSLRLRLLPEQSQSEFSKLLRDYVGTRLDYEMAGKQASLSAASGRTQTEQTQLWSEAVAAVKTNQSSPLYALFIGSLNDAFDLQAKRTAARVNHVPEIVYYLLFFVAAVAMGLVGFGCGVGYSRHLQFTVSVAVLISMVIMVIMDLDRPLRGFIEISQQSMIAIRNNLK